MTYLKIAGLAWGLIFIGVGYIMAFAGRIDFSGIVFLGGTFLLPLPVSVVALWFPRMAGGALLAINFLGQIILDSY